MTMNHWYQSMYQMFELVSDFIEAWLCYGFVGLFLPDRVRGKVLFFILSLVLGGFCPGHGYTGHRPIISTSLVCILYLYDHGGTVPGESVLCGVPC